MKFWNLEKDPGQPDGVLDIDGEIVAERGWFTPEGAVIAKDLRKALAEMRNVTVHINSPGGDVMAGAEIYSALREHSLNGHGEITVIVTALAASAASVIAMAGDRIMMSPTAYMMIHNPWSMAVGDAHEMRKTARTLDVISEGLINAYQMRTGLSRDELKRMLEAETWMSAGTAVEKGFADEIYGVNAGQAGGPRAVACLMDMRSHGAQEIAHRYAAAFRADEDPEEAPEEKPDEEEEAPAEGSEKPAENADRDRQAGADPSEDAAENPNNDPGTEETDEPEEAPEEEPETEETEPDGEAPEEEEPEENPDEKKPDEQARRAEISRRAQVLADLY